MSNAPQAVWLTLLLILPIAALVGRRISWRRGGPMLLAWIAIFAAAWLVVSVVRQHAQAVRSDGKMVRWTPHSAPITAHQPQIDFT